MESRCPSNDINLICGTPKHVVDCWELIDGIGVSKALEVEGLYEPNGGACRQIPGLYGHQC